MGHYAKIENNIVTKVIVAKYDFIEYLTKKDGGQWIKTSYNTLGGIHYDPVTGNPSKDQSKALRKNYAGIGYYYDEKNDAFIPKKPYESWVLNKETFLWEAPIDKPNDETPENLYTWNESSLKWEKIKI